MLRIAVIGARETVMGFKALGLEVFPVESVEAAEATFKKITKPGGEEYAIIYLEENLAMALEEETSKFKGRPTPAVILIPGREGSLGLGQSALRAAVEKAVGTDIL